MDRETALRLSQEFGIHYLQTLREEWEMVILKALFDSPLGKNLIFKGGTALRLAYGSPRFSEDLDFSIVGRISEGGFRKTVYDVPRSFPRVEVTDFMPKFNTYLAELRVKEPWSELPFRIKIEISKRRTFFLNKGYEAVLLSSPATNIQVLANVATLDNILKEKYSALKTRKKARDLFDIWYIEQKLKVKTRLKGALIPKKELIGDLRKYLPRNYWDVIDKLGG